MARKMLLFDGDGNPQLRLGDGKKVAINQRPTSIPGRVMLLIDCSGSMSGTKLEQAKDGSVSFADKAISLNNLVGLAYFDSGSGLLFEPTSNLEEIKRLVQNLCTSGTTNMAEGITTAERSLGSEGQRTIVVVSDGNPDSRSGALEAANSAKSHGIDIICIGVDAADLGFLRQIASIESLAQKVGTGDRGLEKALAASVNMLRLKGK